MLLNIDSDWLCANISITRSVFDGLEAPGTFVEVSEVPASSNIAKSKWLLKWKSDAHGMIDKAEARLVAKGYSQVEGVDYFSELLPPLPRPRLTDSLQQWRASLIGT